MVISVLLFTQLGYAQLIPGINVNGTAVSQGDTVRVCKGNSLTYTSTATGYTTISWFLHLGTPAIFNAANPGAVLYNGATGIDSTIQIISDGIDFDTIFIKVWVSDVHPVADFTSNNNVCSGVAAQFNGTASSGTSPYTYAWSFGGGGTSTLQNPTHAFTSLGCGTAPFTNTLTVTDAFGCASNTASHPITILQAPDVQLQDPDLISPFSNCENSPTPANPSFALTVNNISPSAACITTYTVNWGDGNPTVSPATFPLTHTYTSIGAFNLVVTAMGSNGCSSTKTYTVANQTNPAGSLGTLGSTTNLCAPAIVPFTISNWQINSPGTIYTLSFGDGNSVTLTHPLNPGLTTDTIYHTYNTTSCPALSFTATLSVTNACGTTPYTAGNIQVRIKPTAAFTPSPSPACTNQPVCFTNTSTSGTGVNCSTTASGLWDFGDGSPTSNQTNPCHSYTTPGTYTVTLTMTNFCGSSITTRQVCIRNPPQASFTMSSKTACETGTATINNTSPVGTCLGDTYLWTVAYTNPQNCGTGGTATFINGTNANSTNPQLQFTGAGIYVITLRTSATSTSALSCAPAIARDTFIVKTKPKVSIGTLPNICINNTISPVATVTSCYDTTTLIYAWTFTGGTPATASTLNPGTILYTVANTYPVVLDVTNSCGTSTDTKNVIVGPPPIADAGLDKEFCSGASTSIGTPSITGITYSWSPATGLSSAGAAAPTVTLVYTGTAADTVKYVLTVSSGVNCSTTDTVIVIVKKKPTVTASALNAAICIGDSTTITAAGADTYSWTPAATLNSATANPVIAKPLITTTYTVTGTINGCTNTAQATVTVNAYPATDAGRDTMVCNNTAAVQLTGSPAGGAWTGPNITSGGLFNPQAAGNGIHILYYTVTSNGCTKKDSLFATVIDPPIANAGNDSTVCQSASPITLTGIPAGGTWSGDPLITPGGVFTPSTPGIHNLIYTVGSGSCIKKDTVSINTSAGISNNLISASQQICINTQPSALIGQAATGGNGPVTYQWDSSANNINWFPITPPATGLNYSPPVLTATTYYRRRANTSLCAGVQGSTSPVITITVRPDAKALFTDTAQIKCAPFNLSTVITVTPFPAGNATYYWYYKPTGSINFIPLPGSPNTTGLFPGYIINTPGDTVIIKLVTISPYGCKPDSMQRTYITTQSVTAGFTKDKSAGCDTLKVTFVNTSTILNATIKYFWDFGNGISSNAIQPPVISYVSSPFHNDTTYYITLKAYNGCDTSRWLDSVKIRANPKANFGVDTTKGCSPFKVHFTNSSQGGPSTYYWDFGDGQTLVTTATTPFDITYHVGVTDTFRVRLIAVNVCKADTFYLDIVVFPNTIQPHINVPGNQLFGCAPHTVIFNNATVGATIFTWDFGDASPPFVTSATQNAVPHTYNTAGIFAVSVRIQNGCSDTTVFLQVEVFAKPVAAFTTNGTVFCAGDTVRVNNNSQNANAYRWDFGDGLPSSLSSLPNPTHVYATGGTYTIKLNADKVITSGIVCSDLKQQTITVTNKPAAVISSNIAAINCIPFTLNVSAAGIGNEIATWTIDTSTAAPPLIVNGTPVQYTYTKPGTYTVKLVLVNSAGCKDSALISFTVRNKPTAAFAPLHLSTCKNDTTVTHINNSTYSGIDPLQYRWLVDNVPAGTGTNLTHQYLLGAAPLPRTFNTWLIVSNTLGCSDTMRGTVIMQQPPKALFSFNNPNTCVPFSLQVTNTSTAATSYKWLLNGVQVSTAATPSLNITQPSLLYTVSLVADNSFGCKPDTFTRTFTSLARPKALFTVSDTLGCNGSLNVAMTNLSTGANNYTWIWSDGSPNSNFINPTHLYNALGTFPIILIASDGTCRDTATVAVKIAVKPVANFAANKTVDCGAMAVAFTNLSTNAISYLWDLGDGTLDTQTNPFKLYAPRAVAYTVKLVATGTYGCKDSMVKPNYILAKLPPPAGFVVSPGNIIAVPNYTFNFINTTPQSNNYRYFWNFGDFSLPATTRDASHRYQDTGRYLVSLGVFDSVSNCTDTVYQYVQVTGFPGYLYVPNAFQPNSLQPILKTFLPLGRGLATYRLQIFTTWGQKIFESSKLNAAGSPTEGWNGLYNGGDNFNQGMGVQQDSYIWRIDASFLNGTQWQGMQYPNQAQPKRVGTITLIR